MVQGALVAPRMHEIYSGDRHLERRDYIRRIDTSEVLPSRAQYSRSNLEDLLFFRNQRFGSYKGSTGRRETADQKSISQASQIFREHLQQAQPCRHRSPEEASNYRPVEKNKCQVSTLTSLLQGVLAVVENTRKPNQSERIRV